MKTSTTLRVGQAVCLVGLFVAATLVLRALKVDGTPLAIAALLMGVCIVVIKRTFAHHILLANVQELHDEKMRNAIANPKFLNANTLDGTYLIQEKPSSK